ncbi:Holliday junction branch migration protein RuvA [Ktedonospora formicarum]|uniref:Holliday junction branch migration complex subunit RuvA n=1 Tax=Ktedonospora formicarum TaxID=2778364 RepID=A0A8J3HX81_9CHLR|nr:Holliday junction branch migration protein RuvA [Ktedonospora formicarum]GHO45434.1 Holliday junction ATP-dependent DNA helicase RuvA [Ktedonospora formicarum]
MFAPAIELYPGSHTRFSMIKSIHGTLQACHPDYALIRVGGFGIQVFAPATTISHLGETGTEVGLHTHFHMREDGITLYGFLSEMDRDAFEQLIAISGVGPRVALSLLSIMDATTLYQAIADEDQQRLGMAKGVGKRLAAQLILALKGKLPSIVPAGTVSGVPTGKVQAEALEALIGLGYSNAEAQAAISKIPLSKP